MWAGGAVGAGRLNFPSFFFRAPSNEPQPRLENTGWQRGNLERKKKKRGCESIPLTTLALSLVRTFASVVCCPIGYDDDKGTEGDAGDQEPVKRRRPLSNFQAYKLVKLEPDGTRRPLTNQEVKEFEKTHGAACEWNKPLNACARQWQKQCLNLLKKMTMQKKLSWAFNEPVDPVVLGIPDYPNIIKHPMDLKTIEGMLLAGEIATPDEFTALCRTVFRNAYVYNKPGAADGVRECAEKLSLVFEKEIAKM